MNSTSTKPTAAPGPSPRHHAAQPSWLPSPTPPKSNACGSNSATNPAKPCASLPHDRLTNAQLQAIPLQRLRTLHDQIKAEAATAMRKASRLQREQIRIKRAITRKTQAETPCAE